ncbi:hypothetical protein VTJ04DRAFT_5255 [Mycothermus thermophilus]|uniref:uncharacterized protein n=1 Tax=Humicola insolens TaxID=85995 RepID=UPI0037421180
MTDTDHRSPSEDVGATNKSILAQDKNTPKGAAAEDHSASESTGALYNIGATQQILPPKVGFLAFPLKFDHIFRHEKITIPPKNWLALAYTCRQIYTEAISLVYRSTLFNFAREEYEDQLNSTTWFLDIIGPVNAQYVTKVMVKFPEFGSQIQAMNAASSNSTATVDFDDVPVRLEAGLRPDRPTVGFLNLPAEIRNTIYNHALAWPEADILYDTCDIYRERPDEERKAFMLRENWAALIYACRQVYADVIPLIYQRTHFAFLEYW